MTLPDGRECAWKDLCDGYRGTWGEEPVDYVWRLMEREGEVYERLQPLWGKVVPELLWAGCNVCVPSVVTSWAGEKIRAEDLVADADGTLERGMYEALSAVHALGVVHNDAEARNFVRDPESKRVVLLDFGHAELVDDADELRARAARDVQKLAASLDGLRGSSASASHEVTGPARKRARKE